MQTQETLSCYLLIPNSVKYYRLFEIRQTDLSVTVSIHSRPPGASFFCSFSFFASTLPWPDCFILLFLLSCIIQQALGSLPQVRDSHLGSWDWGSDSVIAWRSTDPGKHTARSMATGSEAKQHHTTRAKYPHDHSAGATAEPGDFGTDRRVFSDCQAYGSTVYSHPYPPICKREELPDMDRSYFYKKSNLEL